MAMKINPVLLTVILAWLLIPTGTPDDIITLFIIDKLGFELYIFVLVLVGYSMYNYHITFKKAKRTMGSFVRSFK